MGSLDIGNNDTVGNERGVWSAFLTYQLKSINKVPKITAFRVHSFIKKIDQQLYFLVIRGKKNEVRGITGQRVTFGSHSPVIEEPVIDLRSTNYRTQEAKSLL